MFKDIIGKEQALYELLTARKLQKAPDESLLLATNLWSEAVWSDALSLGPIHISTREKQQGLTLIQSPVFICGVHRSGTTLVRDLLDGHPDLVVLPSEGTYYTNLEKKLNHLNPDEQISFLTKEWLRRMANPINQAPYLILGRTTDSLSPYVRFAQYCIGWWKILSAGGFESWPHLAIILAYASSTGNPEAKCWVDKTPNNEIFLRRIWQEMPNAKIIYLMRDPRDIMSSRKKLEPGFRLLPFLREMKKSFNIAKERVAAFDKRFFMVRYEELTMSPAETINKLVSFLQIGFPESLNIPTVAGIATRTNSSFLENGEPGRILKPVSRDKRDDLNYIDSKILSAFVGKQATRFQYAAEELSGWKTWYWKLRALWRYMV